MAEAPLLELRGITKRFPGVLANDRVDFDLRHGEVHALLGENGAGKSTLMNILYGLYTPDEGEILLNGARIDVGSTKASIEHGIGMVHQHFMLIPVMTVAENIVLAIEPRHAGVLLDYDAAAKRVREISERYGLAVDPYARIDRITVGQQQRVEILKALYRGAEILILDEPTAVLTPQEAQELFEILRSLKTQGKSIIFISHKLNEVLEIADRDHDASAGQGRRHDSCGRCDRGGPRAHDGRPRSAPARRQEAGLTRCAAAPGRGSARVRRPWARDGARSVASRCAAARYSGSPASTRTARAS